MKEQEQRDDEQRHPVQTVLLIILESLLTFLLKTDRLSRQQAHTLIQREVIVEVRTYFPADTFYATFTDKGVLLDFSVPEGRIIDAIVTASIPDLTRAFMTAPPQILEKIHVEGDDELVQSLHALMRLFNVQHIMRNWWRGVWGGDDSDWVEKEPKYNVKRMRRLQKQVDEHHKTIESLGLQLHEQTYQYRQLQYRYQRAIWIAGFIGIMLVLIIAFLLIQM